MEKTENRTAIILGVSLLVMAIMAMIPEFLVPSDTILLSTSIRLKGLCYLIVLILDIIVSWNLFVFFKPVNINFASLTALFRLMYTAMLAIAVSNYIKIIVLLNINSNTSNDAINLYMNAFNMEWSFGLIVFGIHLLLLAYLVLKAKHIPKIIGVLILVGSICYIVVNLASLLYPDYGEWKSIVEMILGLPMALSELSLAFWMLYTGRKKLKV